MVFRHGRRRFPVANMEGLAWYGVRPPPAAAIRSVKEAIRCHNGVFHVSNHGFACTAELIAASKAFFDQPAASKWACAVGDMDRSRGWEMYPQHMRYHTATVRRNTLYGGKSHSEPSAVEGILCERFVCGPPSICNKDWPVRRPFQAFYDSDWARVFYERNVWPTADGIQDIPGPSLRSSMEGAYPQLESVALASLQLVAAALGVPHTALDTLVARASREHPEAPLRHHSRLQINNYPSIVHVGHRPPPIRASRHFDTSMLTVLSREPRVDSEASAGSSGALEVYDHAEERWVCVPARDGELTVFLGNLIGLLTGFRLRGTTHRVSNPVPSAASDSRRLSIGFNLKPDYTAPATVPPAVREAMPWLPRVPDGEGPMIGLVGRVGWQNHAMMTQGLTRLQAVSSFKSWKNHTVARLRAQVGEAVVY